MSKLVVLMMFCLIVSSAFAQIDADANSVGLYWDTAATIVEAPLAPYQNLYIVLTNPTFDAIKGIELGIDWDETACTAFPMALPGTDWTNYGNNHQVIIGIGSAYPTSVATVMGTITFAIPSAPVYLVISGLEEPSIEGIDPVVVDGDDNMFQIGTSVGSGNIAAMMGDTGVVDAESETWGGVKSLYR